MSTGTVDQAVVEFPGMESFYVDRGGKSSPESDYGCHNVDDLGVNPTDPRPHRSWLRYRVSYVEKTGDFYAVALVGGFAAGGHVILLGSVGPGHVEKDVYAHFEDWAEGKGSGRPLSWFVERIRTFAPKRLTDADLPAGVGRFDSIEVFYDARGGRYSGESGYGVFNRDDLGVRLRQRLESSGSGLVFIPHGEPNYRVSYVHDTGDFYAVEGRFETTAQVALLGSVGQGHEEPEVCMHFADWAQGDGPGRPFSWFVERIASFPSS